MKKLNNIIKEEIDNLQIEGDYNRRERRRYSDEERAEYYKNRSKKKVIDKTKINIGKDKPEKGIISNEVMSPEMYGIRRNVMGFVYDARRLDPTIPRIRVRIADISLVNDVDMYGGKHNFVGLGGGFRGKPAIWIPLRVAKTNDDFLRAVTYHELLHAGYGTPHVDNSPLMKPIIQSPPLSKNDADKLFLSHVKYGGGVEWENWWNMNKNK